MSTKRLKAHAVEEIKVARQKAGEIDTDVVGVKNILEVIYFIFALIYVALTAVSNGVQITDALILFGDDDVREHFTPALMDSDEIPMEIADLSVKEGLKIGRTIIEETDELFDKLAA